jgi:hypothetical protein
VAQPAGPPPRDVLAEVFSRASYNPLLAGSPLTAVERDILARAPGDAHRICRALIGNFRFDDRTIPEWLWAWIGDLLVEDPEAARWPLLYAVMLNHELRHHLDVYGTGLGAHFVTAVGQEYRVLAGAVDADARGRGRRTDWIERHRRLTAFRVLMYGRARATQSVLGLEFEELPVGAWATMRVRDVPVGEVTWPVVTLHREGVESALSLTGILEARALIETVAFSQGRLIAAEVDEAPCATAARLLFAGLDRSPDWYRGIFAALQSGVDGEDLSRDWWPTALPIFAAAWHALNAPAPLIDDEPYKPFPVYRFCVALSRAAMIAASTPGKWFAPTDVHRDLAAVLGDPPTLRDRENEWLDHIGKLYADRSFGDGPAADHLGELADVGIRTIIDRQPRGEWVNALSGYAAPDAIAVGVDVLGISILGWLTEETAPTMQVKLLEQCRRVSRRSGTTNGDLAAAARPLFPALPNPFDPDEDLYGPV